MRYFVAGVAAIIAVCGTGCGSKTNGPSTTTTSEGQKSEAPAGADVARAGDALVRFVNADPNGKPRELWMDDNLLVAGVAYKAISPYSEVRTKNAKFHIRETKGLDDLATVREEFLPGWHYTLVASPRKSGLSGLVVLRDDLVQPKPGMTKIRMVNVTLDVDDLDLYAMGTQEKLQKGVDPSGSTKFSEVPPGVFEIRPARRPMPPRLSKLAADPDRLLTFIVVGKTGDLDVITVEDRLTAEASRR